MPTAIAAALAADESVSAGVRRWLKQGDQVAQLFIAAMSTSDMFIAKRVGYSYYFVTARERAIGPEEIAREAMLGYHHVSRPNSKTAPSLLNALGGDWKVHPRIDKSEYRSVQILPRDKVPSPIQEAAGSTDEIAASSTPQASAVDSVSVAS